MTRPPGALCAICYARLSVAAPEASSAFAVSRLGLQPAGIEDNTILVRADCLTYSLAYLPEGQDAAIGVELADMAALEAVAITSAHAGFPTRPLSETDCQQRRVRAGMVAVDGSGNRLEFVVGPHHAPRRFFGSRDAGVTGLQGIGLRSTDIDRDTQFWASLGARVSDRVGEITYLALDGLHHRIVLYPASSAGILYIALAVETLDHIMQNQHFLDDHQVRILQGPARSPASGAAFLHVQGADGIVYSYAHGISEIDPNTHRPRQFAAENASLCSWGSICDAVPELRFPASTPTAIGRIAERIES